MRSETTGVGHRLVRAIGAATVGGLALLWAGMAAAQYPDRPVAMVIPFGAGGTTDLIARTLALAMERPLGQRVAILNKDGAAGVIGTTELMRAKPDGYTVGMIPVGPLTTQPHIRELPYNTESFDHICMAYSNPQVLIVARESPINSVAEFVANAKRNPGQVRHGSSGPGSIPHLAMIDFARKAGIDIVHVPQKGEADSFRALLGGVIEAFPVHTGFVLANADRVKAIGIMAESRRAEFPGVGTFREAGYDVAFDVWGGVVAPKGVSAAAKGRLEAACRAAFDSPEYQAQLKTLAMPPLFMAGAEFESFVRAEFAKNGALLREAGLAKR